MMRDKIQGAVRVLLEEHYWRSRANADARKVADVLVELLQEVTLDIRSENEWSPEEPESLIRFVKVEDPFINDDLYQITQGLGGQQGFWEFVEEGKFQDLSRAAYDQILSHGWLYDFERGSPDYTRQVVRTPEEMFRDQKGCCLDFACLFAAILENMQAYPLIIRVSGNRFAHAIAGCWQEHPGGRPIILDSEFIRNAVRRKEMLIFETTGAARANAPVARESREWRQEGKGFLSFDQAVETARNLLLSQDVVVDFLIDVLAAR